MSSRSDDPRRRPLARLRRDRGLRNATARRRSDRKAEDRNVTSDTLLAGKASEDQRPPPNSSRGRTGKVFWSHWLVDYAATQKHHRQILCDPRHRGVNYFSARSPAATAVSAACRAMLNVSAASIQEQLGAAKFVVAEFSRQLFDPSASFLDPLSHRLLGFEKDGPFSARCCSSISNMMAACSMPAGSERGCRKGRSPCSIAG